MVSQDDFSETWTDSCDSKHVKVEVQVYDDVYEAVYESNTELSEIGEIDVNPDNFSYIEIPTTKVETIINSKKDSSIKRTAEVRFPNQWDGNIIRPLVVGYGDSVETLSFAKVYHRDSVDDEWQITHFGFISGVSGTSVTTEQRMWVYDFRELANAIRTNQSFVNAQDTVVLDYISDQLSELIPLSDITREITDLTQFQNRGTFLGSRTRYGNLKKSFSSNRNNILDVINWYADQSNQQWEFIPTKDGVVLTFSELNSLGSQTLTEDEDITVIQNTALNSIVPENAVSVRGAKGASLKGIASSIYQQAFNNQGNFLAIDKYPIATAYIPNLVSSADNLKLFVKENAEIDAVTKSQAENTAKTMLYNELKEATNGEIILDGNKSVDTRTFLVASETCNREQFANTAPVRYQVENVRHVNDVRNGKNFETYCQVSLAIEESDIEVESEMVNADD